MGHRLASIDMVRKMGRAAVSLSVGRSWVIYLVIYLVPIFLLRNFARQFARTQCRLGRGLPPYQLNWHPSNRLATVHQRYRQDRQEMVP